MSPKKTTKSRAQRDRKEIQYQTTLRYDRFHIYLNNKKRTTISIEKYITDTIALILFLTPRSEEAFKTIQSWLQERQDKRKSDKLESYSIKQDMFLEIIGKLDSNLKSEFEELRYQQAKAYDDYLVRKNK